MNRSLVFTFAVLATAGCASSEPVTPSRDFSDSPQVQAAESPDRAPAAMSTEAPVQYAQATSRPAKWYESTEAGTNLPPPKNLPPVGKNDESLVHRPTGSAKKQLEAKGEDKEQKRPSPENTGVTDQKDLKKSEKIQAKDGQVIENLFITGGIKASDTSNVVIRNCVIDAAGGRYGVVCQGATNLVVERCEIYGMASAAVYGDGYTARSNNVSQSKGDGFKAGHNVVIEGNYVHTLGFNSPGAHADGVQVRGGTNVKIIGNYFDMPITAPNTHSNAAVFIHDEKGKQRPAKDVLVEGNWFRGGNFTISAYSGDGGDASTIRIINNRFFQGEARYGAGKVEPGVQWSGNIFDGSGAACGPAAK